MYSQFAPTERHPVNIFRPLRLLREKDVVCLLIPTALQYTLWFMVLTSQSTLLSNDHGFSTSQVGFSRLSSGMGSLTGSLRPSRVMGWFYKQHIAR